STLNSETPVIEIGDNIIYDHDAVTRLHNSLEEFKNETRTAQNKILNNLNIIIQYITGDKGVDFLDKLNPINGLKSKDLDIPIGTIDDFNNYMDVLTADSTCSLLNTCIDKDYSITKSFVTMLKMFSTKPLASTFTASKKINGKKKFVDTPLFDCMIGIMKSRRRIAKIDTCENEMRKALSAVLTNVHKWKN
ncbi:hypothetical protein PV326_000510, partial [Microctonus aethiopoides]